MEASCHYSQMANFLTACVRLDVQLAFFVLNVVVLVIAVPFVFDSRPLPGVFLLVPNAGLLFPPAFWV